MRARSITHSSQIEVQKKGEPAGGGLLELGALMSWWELLYAGLLGGGRPGDRGLARADDPANHNADHILRDTVLLCGGRLQNSCTVQADTPQQALFM